MDFFPEKYGQLQGKNEKRHGQSIHSNYYNLHPFHQNCHHLLAESTKNLTESHLFRAQVLNVLVHLSKTFALWVFRFHPKEPIILILQK